MYLSKTALSVLTTQRDLSTISSVQWGLEHEKGALLKYSKATGREVFKCGLVIHRSGMFAASLDGITIDGTAVEVKCPFKLDVRTNGPLASLGSSSSYFQVIPRSGENVLIRVGKVGDHRVCFLNPKVVSLKRVGQGRQYFCQIQGGMFVCDLSVCDIVVWTPKESVVLRVQRDEDWMLQQPPRLASVFKKYVSQCLLPDEEGIVNNAVSA